jgi:hypothetical protein
VLKRNGTQPHATLLEKQAAGSQLGIAQNGFLVYVEFWLIHVLNFWR